MCRDYTLTVLSEIQISVYVIQAVYKFERADIIYDLETRTQMFLMQMTNFETVFEVLSVEYPNSTLNIGSRNPLVCSSVTSQKSRPARRKIFIRLYPLPLSLDIYRYRSDLEMTCFVNVCNWDV
jgi:hypothetical protein